jgi:phosphoenolpyruvate phosphomutase
VRTTLLKNLIQSATLSFLIEAHNGLSARIAEEAGFKAIWASGLSISTSLGVRDCNEVSWTQVLEILEFMSDVTQIPILLDGDTGYGNFNNMRRLVLKLEQRGVAGVCIEDKVFPKTNSLLCGAQPLAEIDEFCGRIKAGKDVQKSNDFIIVARVEAFVAGCGLAEAIKRADAYHKAGADAILIHSTQHSPHEVLSFKKEWGNRLPVIIVPTTYYGTPIEVFQEYGFSAVIWANHLVRSSITAMQKTAQEIFLNKSLVNVEDQIAPLQEVFRLQGADELVEAEKRYLPLNSGHTRAIILAASRGLELGAVTEDRPKCMVEISGTPILSHIVNTYRAAGITNISVVRGYKRETVNLTGLRYFDNTEAETSNEVYSLFKALSSITGACIISYGDVLFKKYIIQELIEAEADFAVVVDENWKESRNVDRFADYVICSKANSRTSFLNTTTLIDVLSDNNATVIHGEWTGFLKLSDKGASFLRDTLEGLAGDLEVLKSMNMAGLLRRIIDAGRDIKVIYTRGNWLDIDTIEDVIAGSAFK